MSNPSILRMSLCPFYWHSMVLVWCAHANIPFQLLHSMSVILRRFGASKDTLRYTAIIPGMPVF